MEREDILKQFAKENIRAIKDSIKSIQVNRDYHYQEQATIILRDCARQLEHLKNN